jgi:hypothetical protein
MSIQFMAIEVPMFKDNKHPQVLLKFWFLLLMASSMIAGVLMPGVCAQESPAQFQPGDRVPEKPAPVMKLGPNLVSIGSIIVDTAKKEVTVPGRMLRDQTLEFLATVKMGMKSYESAMELDTNATSFNLALIMIGLQRSNAVVPQQHFDTNEAAGDPVEIWVEWGTGDSAHKLRAGELLYDLRTKSVPQVGAWVYTGSTVLENGQYLAELDGVLIGFVHDPASIIENSTGSGINAYGSIRLNPNLKIEPDTPLKLTIKALPKKKVR